jgi:hypothetical protein
MFSSIFYLVSFMHHYCSFALSLFLFLSMGYCIANELQVNHIDKLTNMMLGIDVILKNPGYAPGQSSLLF